MKRLRSASRRAGGRRPRNGASLVLALLLIVVLSVTAAGALTMVGSERRVVDDAQAAAEAHAMARSAYDQFVTDPLGTMAAFTPPAFTGPDSVYFAFSDGYAWVSVQRIRPSISGSSALYLVRSRAVRTAGRPAGTPVAERIFAQYAQWQTGIPLLATWTSLSGLKKSGASGTIGGVDNCGAETPLGGVAVPTSPGYTQSGGASVPTGLPPIVDMGPQADANDMIKIDWAGMVAGTSLTPDITLPGGSWPSFADANYWPVIYVNQTGDFVLPGNGRGLLIVRNNLTISGAHQWDGVIIVGGTLTSIGNNTVNGVVVTGLNVLLGESVTASDLGTGAKTYRYDSCAVGNATSRWDGLYPIRNTSADNWRMY